MSASPRELSHPLDVAESSAAALSLVAHQSPSEQAARERCGSDERDPVQTIEEPSSAMSTVLFDRTRPSHTLTTLVATTSPSSPRTTRPGVDAAQPIPASSLPDAAGVGGCQGESGDLSRAEQMCVVHQISDAASGGTGSATTYILQLNSPDSGSQSCCGGSGTRLETEARKLIFDDGDLDGTTATVRPSLSSFTTPHLAASCGRVQFDRDESHARVSSHPRPPLASPLSATRPSFHHHDSACDEADEDAEEGITLMSVDSPEPRVAMTYGLAPSTHSDGRCSDEGLVPSLAREETCRSVEDETHTVTHASVEEMQLVLHTGVVADDEDEDAVRFQHLTAATAEIVPAMRLGGDDVALVNSRSRTRGSSGSAGMPLPPPPPPPQSGSDDEHDDGWASRQPFYTAREGGVNTPSAERRARRARPLMPPPSADSHEASPVAAPPPARHVRVLCAPMPSPPRSLSADGGVLSEDPQTAVDVVPATTTATAAAASVSATASVLNRSASAASDTTGDAAWDELMLQTHEQASLHASPRKTVSPLTDHSDAQHEVPARLGHAAAAPIARCSVSCPAGSASLPTGELEEGQKGEESDNKHEGDETNEEDPSRLPSHVRPVSSVALDTLAGSPVQGRKYNICAPLQASGSLCPANPLLLQSTASPREDDTTDLRRLHSDDDVDAVEAASVVLASGLGATPLAEASPSPIPPSPASRSLDSLDDDDGDEDSEEGGSSLEPRLHPGEKPSPSQPLLVFECGASRTPPPPLLPPPHDTHGPLSHTESSSPFTASSYSSATPASRSYRGPGEGTSSCTVADSRQQDDARHEAQLAELRAQLEVETERRLQKEEECAALHDLVAVLREKLDTTTVAALAWGAGDRRGGPVHNTSNTTANSNSTLHDTPFAKRNQHDDAVRGEDAPHLTTTTTAAAEVLLWQARHDQLAGELARVKQQLAEQKGVLDVLGLAPPYPDAVLGAARRVVRRLTPRKAAWHSAEAHTGSSLADTVSSTPTPPPPPFLLADVPVSASRRPISAAMESSLMDTPVPIIATLYRRSEELEERAGSDRQQRAAATAHRALSELSANATSLGSVERMLAKSMERNADREIEEEEYASGAPSINEAGQAVLVSNQCRPGKSVAEALRLKRDAQAHVEHSL